MRSIFSTLALLTLCVLAGCKKDYPKFKDNILAPTTIEVHNLRISNVTEKGATINFDINVLSMDSVKSAGIVYSMAPGPALEQENSTFIRTKKAQWTNNAVNITGLSPEVKYYVRAVAVHGSGDIFYSENYSFTASNVPDQDDNDDDDDDDNDDDDNDDDDNDTTSTEDTYYLTSLWSGVNKSTEDDNAVYWSMGDGYVAYIGFPDLGGLGLYFNKDSIKTHADIEKILNKKLPIVNKDDKVSSSALAAGNILYTVGLMYLYRASYVNPELNKDSYIIVKSIKALPDGDRYRTYLIEGEFSCKIALEETPNRVIDLTNGKFKMPIKFEF